MIAPRTLALVTGGTGFIGARLVEALASRGAAIRVTTSNFGHCARIARFPIEMVKADLSDPASMVRALEGCDVVFHLAYKFGGTAEEQFRSNVEGTRTIAEAAVRRGIRRFVHVSSMAAYGPPINGDLTETTPPLPAQDTYSKTKQEIECLLRDLHRSCALPLVILQPTIVYGPYGSTWTTDLIQQVQSYRIGLPGAGLGLCNAVYVDDVVRALLLAADNDSAVGGTYLISGATPVAWREFFRSYERMLDKNAVWELSSDQMNVQLKAQRRYGTLFQQIRRGLARRESFRKRLLGLPPQRWLISMGKKLLSTAARLAIAERYNALWRVEPEVIPPLYLPDAAMAALYVARTHVRIEKARNELGFVPVYDLKSGMALTAEWAEWANLIRVEQLA